VRRHLFGHHSAVRSAAARHEGLIVPVADPIEKALLANEMFDHVAHGRIKIDINQYYALEDAVVAHRELQARKTIGSSILVV
jgi:NADPH:quinone reductase-like Zn-dependent oxidoreductase